MRERARCIGCGRLSPETETNYTLISSQFGWRLNRWRREDGEFVVEWRCPACWKLFKDSKRAADETRGVSSHPPPRPTNPPERTPVMPPVRSQPPPLPPRAMPPPLPPRASPPPRKPPR